MKFIESSKVPDEDPTTMRLSAIPNPLSPEEAREQREAEARWSIARGEFGPDSHSPNRQEMVDLSEIVRQVISARDAEASTEARECFSGTHARLMQSIAASLPLTEEAAKTRPIPAEPEQPRFFSTAKEHFLRIPRASKRRVRSWTVPVLMQSCALSACMLMGVVLGRHSAQQEAPFLPVTDMVADYDRRAANSDLPSNAAGQDPKTIAADLGSRVGIRVKLPKPEKLGAHLLGVRTTEYDGVPTVEANFLKDGSPVAFFQAKAPQRSLRFVQEKRIGDKVFMLRDLGKYRVVAWRNDESVLALVSSLDSDQSLLLASEMRDAPVDEDTA